jgi:hypothetical protein
MANLRLKGEIAVLPGIAAIGLQQRPVAEMHVEVVERLAIDHKRLEAYPTAKRCLPCQQHREKTRAPSKYTGR